MIEVREKAGGTVGIKWRGRRWWRREVRMLFGVDGVGRLVKGWRRGSLRDKRELRNLFLVVFSSSFFRETIEIWMKMR